MLSEEELKEIEKLQSNLQIVLLELDAINKRMKEIELTLNEIEKCESELYKIVGNVIFKKSKDEIKNDLNEEKELLEIRKKYLENNIQA